MAMDFNKFSLEKVRDTAIKFGKVLPPRIQNFIEDIAAKDEIKTIIHADKPTTVERIKKTKDFWPDEEPTPAPTVTPTASPAPLQEGFKVSVPSSTGEGDTDLPSAISQMLGEELDKYGLATESAKVLHHPYMQQIKGMGHGENAGFQTGPGWVNEETGVRGDYNYHEDTGELKYVPNPISGQDEPSEDRGLFRINNGTFFTLINSKKYRRLMKKAEIIDSDKLEDLTPEVVQQAYEKMYDPLMNVRMAKLVYEEYGWGAWFAAPEEFKDMENKIQ